MNEAFHFFWRGPLSNWHMRSFTVEDQTYLCVEQYMMAAKARLFRDKPTYDAIMKATSPKEHKALGRQVAHFDDAVWQAMAKTLVFRGLFAKFSQNKDLLEILLATKGVLVEASPYDVIWGIGLEEHDPRAWNQQTWRGQNWLGFLLTDLRDGLLPVKNLATKDWY